MDPNASPQAENPERHCFAAVRAGTQRLEYPKEDHSFDLRRRLSGIVVAHWPTVTAALLIFRSGEVNPSFRNVGCGS
jgi:hypothetical protein